MMMQRNKQLITVFFAMIVVRVLIWCFKGQSNIQFINSFDDCAAGY